MTSLRYTSALLLLLIGCITGGTRTLAAEFDVSRFEGLAEEEPFLRVDEAFVFSAELASDGSLLAHWQMPEGYYLYRHQFAFKPVAGSPYRLGDPEIPPGKPKVDEFFGDVEVYYHEARIRVPLTAPVGTTARVEVDVVYQGCADRGLCYPPEKKRVSFDAPKLPSGEMGSAGDTAPTVAAGTQASAADLLSQDSGTEQGRLTSLLASGSWLAAVAIFFVAGVGLAFTPCVLPMVPILSTIIVGDSNTSQTAGAASPGTPAPGTPMRAFSLSLAYVLGMAFTYAFLGVLVGLFGAEMNLQAALQSPPVLIGFALVFAVLSLAMFGFYELRLPAALQDRLNSLSQRQAGGKHASVVVMGALSALVVSPCVSAPLAAALIYLSTTNDAFLGGTALLALGLGMGTPLLLIGASGGHLLPRAGAWMESVKAVFGVLLLGVAVWLLERVIPASLTLLLWAMLAIGCGVYLGALDFSPRKGWGQLWKAGGALSLVYGVLLMVGAASGGDNPLRPLAPFAGTGPAGQQASGELVWRSVDGPEQLSVALAQSGGRISVLDLYADWCISCKVMERNVFPLLHAQLSEFQLLRADLTENDAPDKALLAAYGLFGPPSLLFFAPDGNELVALRIQGEIDAPELASHLARVSSQVAGNPHEVARR